MRTYSSPRKNGWRKQKAAIRLRSISTSKNSPLNVLRSSVIRTNTTKHMLSNSTSHRSSIVWMLFLGEHRVRTVRGTCTDGKHILLLSTFVVPTFRSASYRLLISFLRLSSLWPKLLTASIGSKATDAQHHPVFRLRTENWNRNSHITSSITSSIQVYTSFLIDGFPSRFAIDSFVQSTQWESVWNNYTYLTELSNGIRRRGRLVSFLMAINHSLVAISWNS